MAKKKISELPAGGALNGTELVPIVQTGTTKQITAQDIANLGNASGVEGSGTINRLPKFTASSTIGNSAFFDDGTNQGTETTTAINRFIMSANASIAKIFSFRSGNLPRWAFRVDGTESGANAGADLAIRRYNDAGTFIDAPLFIKRSTGNVGIGTTTPFYKFEVSDGTRTAVINPNASLDGIFLGVKENKPLVFGTNDNERMRITSAGNVGIGTDAPTGKLEIRGLQSASKNLLLNLSKFDYGATQFYQNYSNTFYSGGKSLEIEVEGLPLLQLAVNNAGSAGKVIFPNGPVLIGTTTDAGYKLDVNGTARFAGDVILTKSGTSTLTIKGNAITGFDLQNDTSGVYLWNRDATPIYFGTNATQRLIISGSGVATFSGQVNIGNPVNAAIAVASTHKVTIVIGGVTYYLLASNV